MVAQFTVLISFALLCIAYPSFGRRLELLSFDRVVIVVVRDRRNFAAVSFSME